MDYNNDVKCFYNKIIEKKKSRIQNGFQGIIKKRKGGGGYEHRHIGEENLWLFDKGANINNTSTNNNGIIYKW